MKKMQATILSADMLALMRERIRTSTASGDARRPFRFFLCGDPGLVADFRALLLRGHEDAYIPLDAVATLETIDPLHRPTVIGSDARCVIFLGRRGDAAGARFDLLSPLKLPIFALTIDPDTIPNAPPCVPNAGDCAEYIVPSLDRDALRLRFFPHLVECCKGIEIAVGYRFPVLRETVTAKLTHSAALSALKIAAASALVDNVPVLGLALGAIASAGDMVAITGVQIVLMMQIGAAYGKDPDMQRMWELLPVVGGGFGWRMLARELSGFIPVAGIAIKGAIAYAGTIVVGEGITFYYEHGRHMAKSDATTLYNEATKTATSIARDIVMRLRRR